MKKSLLVLSLVVLVASVSITPLPSSAAVPGTAYAAFGDIPYGTTMDDVKKKMTDKGFKYVSPGRDNDLSFVGIIDSRGATLYCFFDDKGGLMSTTVGVYAPDDQQVPEYDQLVSILTKKYGTPDKTYRTESVPYKDGDGKILDAIKNGNADYSTYWEQPGERCGSDDSCNQVSVWVGSNGYDIVSYQGPGWSAYHASHKPDSTSSL